MNDLFQIMQNFITEPWLFGFMILQQNHVRPTAAPVLTVILWAIYIFNQIKHMLNCIAHLQIKPIALKWAITIFNTTP